VNKRPASDQDINTTLSKKQLIRSFFNTPGSGSKSRADGLCFYRCILHKMHGALEQENFPALDLDYLQGQDDIVISKIDLFRRGVAKALLHISQDVNDQESRNMWAMIEGILRDPRRPVDFDQWHQRMMVSVKELQARGGQDHWADDLTVEVTPIVFAMMGHHIELQIYRPNGSVSSIRSTVPMGDVNPTIIRLSYDGVHYDLHYDHL
jgi:hypothetical protein